MLRLALGFSIFMFGFANARAEDGAPPLIKTAGLGILGRWRCVANKSLPIEVSFSWRRNEHGDGGLIAEWARKDGESRSYVFDGLTHKNSGSQDWNLFDNAFSFAPLYRGTALPSLTVEGVVNIALDLYDEFGRKIGTESYVYMVEGEKLFYTLAAIRARGPQSVNQGPCSQVDQ